MFVMSSKREGVPVALLEAMARGLPIVATRVGGIPEVIRDGVDGLLCDSGNPDLLADRIVEMMGNDSLRISCAASARLRAESDYGSDSMVSRWQELYMRFTSKGAAGG